MVRGGNSDSFVTPWTVARQAPLSVEFSRQEYWSGLPFAAPGDLPKPEIKPASPVSPVLAGGFLGSPVKKDRLDIWFKYLNILLRILFFPREKDYIIIFQHCTEVERAQTLKS